jgi:hypothetical protein
MQRAFKKYFLVENIKGTFASAYKHHVMKLYEDVEVKIRAL